MLKKAILRLSQGSYSTAIVARNTINRVLAMDLDGFFSRAILAFFKADEDQVVALSPRHTVIDIAVAPRVGGVVGQLRAEAGFLGRVMRLIREEKVVALSANDPYLSGLNAMILSALTNVPYVIEVLSDYDLSYRVAGKRAMPFLPSRETEKRVEKIVYKNASVIYSDTDYYLKYAKSSGADPSKFERVRRVTDPFYYGAAPERRPGDYFDLRNRRMLFYAGRLSGEKYPLDLVECLSVVRRSGEDAVLVLAGDGDQRANMEQRAEQLDVRDSLVLLGNRTAQELVDLAYGADVLLASHAGYALVELALSATPIVAYDYEWHPEVVRDGETGLLAPYRNPTLMAERVLRLLRDPTLSRRLGGAARDFVLRHNDWPGAIRDERGMYEALLSSKFET